jgi:cytosine/adenosine deaminase-related metal-dependent hydrolase
LIEGTVVTVDPSRRVIVDGGVTVRGDRIVEVDKASELRERVVAKRVLGGAEYFVIPGLIDSHNHLAQALVRENALEDLPNVGRIYHPCRVRNGRA